MSWITDLAKIRGAITKLQEAGEISFKTRYDAGKLIEAMGGIRKYVRTEAAETANNPGIAPALHFQKAGSRALINPTVVTPQMREFMELNNPQLRVDRLNKMKSGWGQKTSSEQQLFDLAATGQVKLDDDIADLLVRYNQEIKTRDRLLKQFNVPKSGWDNLRRSLDYPGASTNSLQYWRGRIISNVEWKLNEVDNLAQYEKPSVIEDYLPHGGRFGYESELLGDINEMRFTEVQRQKRLGEPQEINFINRWLSNPESAKQYAESGATPYWFNYWNKEKGGFAGVQAHNMIVQGLLADQPIGEFGKLKYGDLTSIKNLKEGDFKWASIQGAVIKIFEDTKPNVLQSGLLTDASGESIKFTVFKNNVPKNFKPISIGETIYAGNVPVSSYKVGSATKYNINFNKNTWIVPLKQNKLARTVMDAQKGANIQYGVKTSLIDKSKPYSINPRTGEISFTTPGNKKMKLPMPNSGAGWSVVPPFIAAPYIMSSGFGSGNLTNLTGLGNTTNTTQNNKRIYNHNGKNTGTRVIENIKNKANAIYAGYAGLGGTEYEILTKWADKFKELPNKLRKDDSSHYSTPVGMVTEEIFHTATIKAGLDILDAVAYPFIGIQQATTGLVSGYGAQKAVANKYMPSDALNLQGTSAFLADIFLDPTIFLGFEKTGLKILKNPRLIGEAASGVTEIARNSEKINELARITKSMAYGGRSNLEKFWKNEEAMAGIAKGAGIKKIKTESIPKPILERMQERAMPQNKNKPAEFFRDLYTDAFGTVKASYTTDTGMSEKAFINKINTDFYFRNDIVSHTYNEYTSFEKTGKWIDQTTKKTINIPKTLINRVVDPTKLDINTYKDFMIAGDLNYESSATQLYKSAMPSGTPIDTDEARSAIQAISENMQSIKSTGEIRYKHPFDLFDITKTIDKTVKTTISQDITEEINKKGFILKTEPEIKTPKATSQQSPFIYNKLDPFIKKEQDEYEMNLAEQQLSDYPFGTSTEVEKLSKILTPKRKYAPIIHPNDQRIMNEVQKTSTFSTRMDKLAEKSWIIRKPWERRNGILKVGAYASKWSSIGLVAGITLKYVMDYFGQGPPTQAQLDNSPEAQAARLVFNRPFDFTSAQMRIGVNQAKGPDGIIRSEMSGLPSPNFQMQGGHMVAIMEGGKNTMDNFILQTVQENRESSSSQLRRQNLPEMEFREQQRWSELESLTKSRLAEINAMKRDSRGNWLDATSKKQLMYNARKNQNLQLYTYEIGKLSRAIADNQFLLRKKQAELKKLRADGMPTTDVEDDINRININIEDLTKQKGQLQAKKDAESKKEFTITKTEQRPTGRESAMVALGAPNMYPITGSGPILTKPENIKGIVSQEELASRWSFSQGDPATTEQAALDDPAKYMKRARYINPEKFGTIQDWLAPLQERANAMRINTSHNTTSTTTNTDQTELLRAITDELLSEKLPKMLKEVFVNGQMGVAYTG